MRLARFARKTLTLRFTDFFTDFEERNRLFCSLVVLQLLPTLSLVLLYSQATQLQRQVDVADFNYPVELNRAKKPTLEGSA